MLAKSLQRPLRFCRSGGQRCAFSLVELLIVLALISILGGAVFGWYAGNHRKLIERLTNQRNAQEIVSIGVCATMGGAEFVVPDDKVATVRALVDGTTGQTGIWKGKVFRLSSLAPESLLDALEFVKFDGQVLLYEPAGDQP
ncbi:MAG: type II secretion system protein [Prosthecobacter sp.]